MQDYLFFSVTYKSKAPDVLKKEIPTFRPGFCFAESKGFEPLVRVMRTTVFETAPFDHSGNSPPAKLEKFKLGAELFYNLSLNGLTPYL